MALALKTEIFLESEWSELVNELSLSPRQAEVVKHLFLAKSDKQIAGDMHISVSTVRTYLSRLFSKFGVQDRIELMLFVLRRFRESRRKYGCHYLQRHHK